MRLLSLRSALILTTVGVLLAFSLSMLPALAQNLYPMLTMLLLMALMMILQCRYALRESLTPQPEPLPAKTAERPVMLILGPYAAKWFSQTISDDDVRYSKDAAWLQITEPQALLQRLNYIHHHAPDTQIMAFFPFLPDGQENSELIVENLMRWHRQFADVLASLSLPCTLAIYARLSNERRRNAPHNASWIGDIDLTRQDAVAFKDALQVLKSRLQHEMPAGASRSQRAVLGVSLLQWMQDSGVSTVFNKLFTHSPLQLCNVMMCDYGNGFHRHGAWSCWLEQKHAILPGLGKSLSLPPFPHVAIPPILPAVPAPPVANKPKLPAFCWSIGIVLLLLSVHLLKSTLQIRQQQVMFQQQLIKLGSLPVLSLQKKQAHINDLAMTMKQWDSCSSDSFLSSWGLSPCRDFASRLEHRLETLKGLPAISTADGPALFDTGSADPLPSAESSLKEIAALARAWPQHPVLIIGHSDNTGDATHNLWLSEKRASVVKNWLIQHAISADRLSVHAVGATEPVASNETAEGRQKNRRVEVLVLPVNNNEMEFTHK